jgi:hypothetical protein
MRFSKLAAAALVGVAALGLSACATGLNTEVTRYQAMPAPQGQTFTVIPGEGMARMGGLEFQRYAGIVAQQLAARGFQPATDPKAATMVVQLGYNVDHGHQVIDPDPFGGPFGGPFFRPRFGFYSPFYYGWGDPFMGDSLLDSHVEYGGEVDMHIRAAGTGQPLFDGRAQARAGTNRLDRVLPPLIEALFTGFPGQNGENVRITIPAHPAHA